jgi:predicted outer membrane repeat protein
MNRLAFLLVSIVVSGALGATVAHSVTWNIDPLGNGDAPHIQAGIDSASTGDIVLLASGTYLGPGNTDVDFMGKLVTVTSSSGALSTIIDCGGSARAFLFTNGEDASAVVSDLTIRNGSNAVFGGAVYCVSASPTIERVVFEDNASGFRGGAIYCDTSSVTIANVVFERNSSAFGGAIWCSANSDVSVTSCEFRQDSASVSGGAIACNGSSPLVEDNLFEENGAGVGGAIFYENLSGGFIKSNRFHNNRAVQNGGAISLAVSSPTIQINTFWRNDAPLGAGLYCNDFSSPFVVSNTFDENSSPTGNAAGVYCTNSSSPQVRKNIISNSPSGSAMESANFSAPRISCCDFFGNADGDGLPPASFDEGGNFFLDPEFCGILGSGNLFLQSDSPCAPGNHPSGSNCELIGSLPVFCSTVNTHHKTWGEIKSLYEKAD